MALVNGRRNVIEILIPLSNVEIKNRNGNTVLHFACKYGSAKTVEMILNKYEHQNMNINEENLNGETPSSIAKSRKHFEIIKLLETTKKVGNVIQSTNTSVVSICN